MKKLLASTLLIVSIGLFKSNLSAQHSCALQASNDLTEIKQPDGLNLKIRIIGNPFVFNVESEDGFTLIKNKEGIYEYAMRGADGSLIPNGIKATNKISARTSNKSLVNLTKHLRYEGVTLSKKVAAQNKFLKPKNKLTNKNFRTATGTIRHLLILIDYPDHPARHTTAEFDSLMNQRSGYNINGQTGSFREYYSDNSYGQLIINTDVVGWYRADHNRDHYATHRDLRNPNYTNARALAREAVDAAEADGVDFSDYDNDGDGIIDVVTIAHQGIGAESQGGNGDAIWSHKTSLASTVRYDNTLISNYTMNPELGRQGISNIGVYVHEFGHALGLPDLYDTNGETNGESNGAGDWCVMASGTWNNGGRTPSDFSAWCKERLAWINPTILSGNGKTTNMKNVSDDKEYFRINTANQQEYFLLANQQQNKWNSSQPGSGLLIWHINNPGSIFNNTVNATANQLRVVPEQADGRNNLENNTNDGDAGDPFPGTTNNTTFNGSSNPNSNTNDGEKTNISITNIEEKSGLISFNYSTTKMEERRIPAEADAMVKSGGNSSKIYGTLDNLNVKSNPKNKGVDKKSFLRFDLSTIPESENIKSAILRLYVKEASANTEKISFAARWVQEDNWLEDGSEGITWNNAPNTASSIMAIFTGATANEYIDIDLTNWVKWENENALKQGDKISILLSTIFKNNDNIKFASKENPNEMFRPVLLINQNVSQPVLNSSDLSSAPLDISAIVTEQSSNISIFPNPANNHINVGIDNLDLDGNIEIKVYNLLGKVVYNNRFSATTGTPFKTTLPLDNVKQGMYLMNVTVNDNLYSTLRFVKN